MKTLVYVMIISILAISVVCAEGPAKITLDAKNMPIKDAMAELTKQTQISIILDPKIQADINLSLSDVELDKALDAITKLNKLTWKKLQFAKSQDDSVKLEQIKSAILTLATVSMIGVQIDDPATKQTTLFAKNLPSTPEPPSVKLPVGYAWTTVYVILPTETETKTDTTDNTDRIGALSQAGSQFTMQLAAMTPEDRQKVYANELMTEMSLAPETRQAMLKDRFAAIRNMGEQFHDQYRQDMRSAFHDMRPQDNGDGRRQRGNDQPREKESRKAK